MDLFFNLPGTAILESSLPILSLIICQTLILKLGSKSTGILSLFLSLEIWIF